MEGITIPIIDNFMGDDVRSVKSGMDDDIASVYSYKSGLSQDESV